MCRSMVDIAPGRRVGRARALSGSLSQTSPKPVRLPWIASLRKRLADPVPREDRISDYGASLLKQERS